MTPTPRLPTTTTPTTAPLPDHGRFGYSAIGRRPPLAWPGGRRLAVYVGFNLEHFAFGEGLGAGLAPPSPQPDVLNHAWREYGNRVGAWRCLDLFDALRLPVGVIANTAVLDHCPGLVDAFLARGDELIGHGVTNSERQGTLAEADETALIVHCRDRLARHAGTPPAGWLSPWISESRVTPDLLQEAGFRYTLNWCHDDQPTRFATRGGRLWSIPYPQELNDIPAIVARQMGAADFARMIVDQFDEMLAQSRREALVMGIALHPYIVGQPYRLRHLRRALAHVVAAAPADVWLTTPGAVADAMDALAPDFPAAASA